MNDNLKQSLSALMDDEASEFEVRRLLELLDDDSADIWSRYHLARSSLQADGVVTPVDLSDRVSEALAAEPAHRAAAGGLFGWRPLGNVAVAAAVTAVVIFGARVYQEGAPPAATAAVARPGLVLPGPTPTSPNFLQAQYGRTGVVRGTAVGDADVIRASQSMEYYLHQHQALMGSDGSRWTATWLPDGFRPVRHEVLPDTEVMVYTDGRRAISVSVEPYGQQKGEAGAIQNGDTVALGKRVGDRFVTVVGDLPLMIADRIASSVDPLAD